MSPVTNTPLVCIVCESRHKLKQAEFFASENKLPLFTDKNEAFNLQLCFNDSGVSLFDRELNAYIKTDFIAGSLDYRRQHGGGRKQPIAKAVGIKPGVNPTVLDATAGLARDAFVLASLGCNVTLVEKSPVLCALINDGIRRALEAKTIDSIINRFTNLVNTDCNIYLEHLDSDSRPDVIYIDPMFPKKRKSALVKKDMQILQKLIGEDMNSELLVENALKYAKKRVVVKRPTRANHILQQAPDILIDGKTTRYDIYTV